MNNADLSKVRVEVRWYQDMWQTIKDATMTTIGKETGSYPDSKWKRDILMAEHSPIRIGHIIVKIYNVPQFVNGHLVRHHNGVTPLVSSLRSDRNNYDEIPNRLTLQSAEYDINFQAFINISRKRLCGCASYETQYVWNKVLEAIKPYEPELYSVCVRDCIYKGFCAEIFSCEYDKTEDFEIELKKYRNYTTLPIKEGDTFWEVNGGMAYPRIAHTYQHCVYVAEKLGEVTFLTKFDALAYIENPKENNE